MLAVIDYGGGNMGSLLSSLRRRGVAHEVTSDPARVATATAAMLPGDGAFAATMQALRERGLDTAITELVARNIPFLGICVGMQVLFEESDEHGRHAGLGIFPGKVRRLAPTAPRIPHMGWNQLEITAAHPVTAGLTADEYVYFLHSYCVPPGAVTVAATTYGEPFSSIVARDNVVATQFHPEKSQRTGGKILDNFLALCAQPANP